MPEITARILTLFYILVAKIACLDSGKTQIGLKTNRFMKFSEIVK